MVLPTAAGERVSELGIDDFSFRRGRKFGTILVDMQSHEVIDGLADRKAETAAAWMATHPEIVLVSRDRGGDYASAAESFAPQAIQCADRFHLLKNLGEALEGVLAHHLAAHRTRLTEERGARPLETAHGIQSPKLSPKEAELCQAKREERLAQYQHIAALRKLGLSQTAIADQVGVAHSTVSRWLNGGTFPEQQPRPRKSETCDPSSFRHFYLNFSPFVLRVGEKSRTFFFSYRSSALKQASFIKIDGEPSLAQFTR